MEKFEWQDEDGDQGCLEDEGDGVVSLAVNDTDGNGEAVWITKPDAEKIVAWLTGFFALDA